MEVRRGAAEDVCAVLEVEDPTLLELAAAPCKAAPKPVPMLDACAEKPCSLAPEGESRIKSRSLGGLSFSTQLSSHGAQWVVVRLGAPLENLCHEPLPSEPAFSTLIQGSGSAVLSQRTITAIG